MCVYSPVNASKKEEIRQLQDNHFIILTIEGNGIQSILYEGYSSLPKTIQINSNEEITGTINWQQNLDLDTNTVKLTWDIQLESCENMFKGLQKIKQWIILIDLSMVTNMNSFFEVCTSLTSVNFDSKSALNVISMNSMFKDCKH